MLCFFTLPTAVTGCTYEETATATPASFADTGKYVGIYKGGGGAGTFDNWTGGDFR